MASSPREGLKQSLLLAFIGLCVGLVVLIWADNLSDRPGGGTGFVRSTATAPLTHVALSATPTATVTPTPLSVLATLTPTPEPDD